MALLAAPENNLDPEVQEIPPALVGDQFPRIWDQTQQEKLPNSEILAQHSLALNVTFKFLSCVNSSCGHVLTGNWARHVRKHYAHTNRKMTTLEEV